jgi:PAS domain S-box-containing protein
MGDPSNLVAQGNTYRVLYLGNDEGFIKKFIRPPAQRDPVQLDFSYETNSFKVYRHLEGGRLSLILLDLTSDVCSGGLDRLAALSEMMPEIPIVALIQRDDAGMMDDIFFKGAQDCLIREEFDWTMLLYLAHNIIRRWRAQATLRSRKDELTGLRQEYQALLRSTPNGLCMVNPDWSIRWANRAMTRFFDPEARHTQELVGNSLQMFFESQADFEQYCALARRAVRTQGIDVREWKLRRLDGSPTFAQLSIVRLDPSQTDPGYAVTLTDVTESRRANEQLRQTKEDLQAIYDGMVDGLVIADSENRHILHVNAAMCGLLGYTETELCKMRIENLHPPDEIPRVLKMYEKILQGKVESLHGLACLHKDGSIHHVDIVARLIHYDDKICVIGFLRDAKERMMMESLPEADSGRRPMEELIQKESHEVLSHAVNNIANCMKNLLAIFSSGLSLVATAQEGRKWDLVRKGQEMLNRSAQRLHLLLMNMLDYTGVSSPSMEETDIPTLFEEVMKSLEQHLVKKNIRFTCEVEQDAETHHLDAQRLFRALLNLGVNSIDAMPKGGMLRLTARLTKQGDSLLSASGGLKLPGTTDTPPSSLLMIEVEDTGAGIPEGMREKIFAPFFTTKGALGIGLGLTCVKKFIDIAGGAITVLSQEGHGTTIRIFLP